MQEKTSPVTQPGRGGDSPQDHFIDGNRSGNNQYCTDAVSGSYRGFVTRGTFFELRVDVDKVREYSPVLGVISGELVENGDVKVHFMSSQYKNLENNSFEGDGVAVSNGGNVKTRFSVRIHREEGDNDWKADIDLNNTTYKCARYSKYFRSVTVDVDHSRSFGLLPPLSYLHRPLKLANGREITVFSALNDAGIEIKKEDANTNLVRDPDPSTPWTDPELYEVMATHHDKNPSRWNVWILLAPHYINPDLLGLMFDLKNRKGCAVFTGHEWFSGMDSPDIQIKATAQRRFIHTLVHEIGHTFNLWHSWDKGRPDSLSFMNYDYLYDRRNGEDSYFEKFTFSFDKEEIRFLRHGPVNWVKPGVSPFLLHSPQLNMPQKSTDQSSHKLKFAIKPNKVSYMLMEVVRLELKLQNNDTRPIEIESKLDPSAGLVTIYINDQSGTVKRVDSLASGSITGRMKELYPVNSKEGTDRISEMVPLVYGKNGFYFKEVGDYNIQAVYTFGNYNVVTEPVKITIQPFKGNSGILKGFFTDEVGEFIALGGSSSTRFEATKRFIKEELEKAVGCHELALEITALCCKNFAYSSRKAFSIEAHDLTVVEKDDPPLLADRVLQSTRQAIGHLRQKGTCVDNIFYRRLAFLRAECHLRKTQPSEAQANEEINRMIAHLESRKVKEYVINEMRVEWKKGLDDHLKSSGKGRSAPSGPAGKDSVSF